MDVRPGDRIRLLGMASDPDPIEPGSTGTVESVTSGTMGQIRVKWDSGRSLALLPGIDVYELVPGDNPASTPPIPDPVCVPEVVFEGILAVRDSGKTNMLDIHAVRKLAWRLGHPSTAVWLSDPNNQKAYAQGVFRGFTASDEGDE
jgi:hypothetical protein